MKNNLTTKKLFLLFNSVLVTHIATSELRDLYRDKWFGLLEPKVKAKVNKKKKS